MKNEKSVAWVCLIIAGLLEFVWAYFVKLSNGFTQLMPTALAIIFLIISFFLLEKGISGFGIGMAYGVFTGIGIAGTAIIGIIAFGETISFAKIFFIMVLLSGIVGLKLCEGQEAPREQEAEQ